MDVNTQGARVTPVGAQPAQSSRWDPGAVSQMEAIWSANGKTLDDAAKDRWAGPGGYLSKPNEVTGAGQRLKAFQPGDQIEDYWKMRMGHDANGTEFDPGGAMRARMGAGTTQPSLMEQYGSSDLFDQVSGAAGQAGQKVAPQTQGVEQAIQQVLMGAPAPAMRPTIPGVPGMATRPGQRVR